MSRFIGERVIVIDQRTNFRGMRGVVTRLEPYLMVHLDGERMPMTFGDRDVIPEHGDSAKHVGGAE